MGDTNELAVIDGEAEEIKAPAPATDAPTSVANPLDLPNDVFRGALNRRKENRESLVGWVREALVDTVDFGRIHIVKNCQNKYACTNENHFSRPSLYKPGAEKICGMLGLKPHFPTLSEYEKAVLEGKELKQIILRCHLIDANGDSVADGVGGRALEQDSGDLNKALKMCAKSAQIDATLRCAGLSEVFTQDVEDMDWSGKENLAQPGAFSEDDDGDPADFRMPFGKHKGKTLREIEAEDPGWMDWYEDKGEKPEIVGKISAFRDAKYGSPADQSAPAGPEDEPMPPITDEMPPPGSDPGAMTLAEFARAVSAAKTLEELESAWDLAPHFQPQVQQFYDNRKGELS